MTARSVPVQSAEYHMLSCNLVIMWVLWSHGGVSAILVSVSSSWGKEL